MQSMFLDQALSLFFSYRTAEERQRKRGDDIQERAHGLELEDFAFVYGANVLPGELTCTSIDTFKSSSGPIGLDLLLFHLFCLFLFCLLCLCPLLCLLLAFVFFFVFVKHFVR